MIEGLLDYNNGVFVFTKNKTECIIKHEQAYQMYNRGVVATMAVLELFEEIEHENYMAHVLQDEL